MQADAGTTRAFFDTLVKAGHNVLTANPDDARQWRVIFGEDGQALSDAYLIDYGAEEPTADVDILTGTNVTLRIPWTVAAIAFHSGDLSPNRIASTKDLSTANIQGRMIIPLRVGSGVRNGLDTKTTTFAGSFGTSQNVPQKLGVGQLWTDRTGWLDSPHAVVYWCERLEEVLNPRAAPNPGDLVELSSLLTLPAGLAESAPETLSVTLLLAADLGLVEHARTTTMSSLPLPSDPQPAGVPSLSKIKLFIDALDSTDPFDQYIRLYQVLENSLIDNQLRRVQVLLDQGNLLQAASEWRIRAKERIQIHNLITEIAQRYGTHNPLRLPPTAELWKQLNKTPLKSPLTTKQESNLLYDIRCALIHTKRTERYLVRTPGLASEFVDFLNPWLHSISRASLV
ncbi:MAG: hypothetical protein SX243_12755 [Acidobacteriota bacterium]|nr:hypothetical protein [Acidobacteriota bacterium]